MWGPGIVVEQEMPTVITWVSAAVFAIVLAGLWAWSGYLRRNAHIPESPGPEEEGES